jgi:hypothetical protein
MSFTTEEFISLLAAEDFPENMKRRTSVDGRGSLLPPFHPVEACVEDQTRQQPPAEPVERKSFFRETLELWREVHDRRCR